MYAIKVYRAERGLSISRLAKESGVPRETISRIEHGHNEPSAATIKKLADALGVSVHDLMYTEERFRRPLFVTAPPSVGQWLDELGATHYLTMSDAEAHQVLGKLTSEDVPRIKLSLLEELNLIREVLESTTLPSWFRSELEAARRTYVQWTRELSRLVKLEQRERGIELADEEL